MGESCEGSSAGSQQGEGIAKDLQRLRESKQGGVLERFLGHRCRIVACNSLEEVWPDMQLVADAVCARDMCPRKGFRARRRSASPNLTLLSCWFVLPAVQCYPAGCLCPSPASSVALLPTAPSSFSDVRTRCAAHRFFTAWQCLSLFMPTAPSTWPGSSDPAPLGPGRYRETDPSCGRMQQRPRTPSRGVHSVAGES